MPSFKSNEWEFQGMVVGWLNEFLATGSYPFDTATANTSLKVPDSTKYPDVLLWINYTANSGYCGWELKPPTIKADDTELLKNAVEKAHTMQADYFVTWNMRDAIIWQTPKPNEIVKAEHRVKQYPSLYAINNVEDLKNEQNKISLKDRAKEVLDDLASLKNKGTLSSTVATPTFFVKKLHTVVDNIYPDVEKALKKKTGLNIKFRNEVNAWAKKQGISNTGTDEFYKMVARQMVYHLLARIIFYETLTGAHKNLPELDLQGLTGQNAMNKLREYFNDAGNIDWQAVFEKNLSDDVELTGESIDVIRKLIEELNHYSFSLLPHDVIGAVFEQLIPETERHSLGQYFTREDLVDLINAFCVRITNAVVLDPTCGTGTFLLRAYDKKKTAGLYDHKELLGQLWGIDIANFPAELATINLFRQNVAEISNFPRIIRKDFFEIKPESVHKFPPLKKGQDSEFQIDVKMPVFDAAVGNFPFIRQELIEKAVKGYKGSIEKVIKQDWLAEYPDAFTIDDSNKNAIIEQFKKGKKIDWTQIGFNLSGQADIYAYLFFHTARFIKEGGRMGFITSNSWLDVAYGYELQKFMLNNFKIIAILESRCEPWFEDAAVNTVVTILERCSNKAERDNHIAKFVKIKKKLADLIPQDIKLEKPERWGHLEILVNTIEKAGEEYLGFEKTGKQINSLNGLETREDDNFRIRIKKQGDLLEELNKEGKTAKWGQYLRAPEIYFEMTSHTLNLTTLKKVANLNRGITTGINDFFYLSKDSVAHWDIEGEFLAPALKSPRESDSITINSNGLRNRIFLCDVDKDKLKATGKNKALSYVKWGENQVNAQGQKWPNVVSVVGRKLWYSLGKRGPGSILLFMNSGDSHRVLFNPDKVYVDHNFFEVHITKGLELGLLLYLNSSLAALFKEVIGRANLGEGGLKVEGVDWVELHCPPKQILKAFTKESTGKFTALLNRPVKPIVEEVKMKDRQKLDSLILEALGLDPKKYLNPLYDGLTELVRERIDLGKMRNKVKKAKVATDTEKIKSQVIEVVLPNGVKKFPEDFLDNPLKQNECETVNIPGEQLKLGGQFLTQHEIFTEEGFKYVAASTATAKYIVYAQKPNLYLIAVPKDDVVTSKAVQKYEIYLKKLKEKLQTQLADQISDYKLADTITEQIFEEFGLPQI
jgi:hypothetical protein